MRTIDFFNNGKECIFYPEQNFVSLEGQIIDLSLIMKQLHEIKISYDEYGLLIKVKKYFIELKYTSSLFDKDIKVKKIYLRNNEIAKAKQLINKINLKRDDENREKEERSKKFEQKVKVIDEEGKEHFLNSYSSQLSDSNLCLVVNSGKTYHTWLDCYEKWLPSMQDEFTCWYIKNKKDAIKKGFQKCKFCEERDYDSKYFDYTFGELENEDD